MSEYSHLVTIQWRLLQMMAERRIKKNTDLAHRLRRLGFEISTRQTGLGMDRTRCFRSQDGRDTHSTE
jgi:hypothetical protein